MSLAVYEDRAEASAAAAQYIITALQKAGDRSERLSVVISGGSTPKRCLELLSSATLPWARISVSLTDERNVPADHPARNAGMVRETLLNGDAASATLLDLLQMELPDADTPYSAVLLGMGEDGHFASIFPDIDNLAEALDLNSDERCLSVQTSASEFARTTMTLAELLRSRQIILLAFGAAKRAIIDAPQGYPIAHVLQQNQTPVQVIWAP